MVGSSARTIDEYLRSLPAERRAVVSAVRDVVRRNLPEGYSESMGYGMIVHSIPLARYPDTYNGQPLCYAARAAQKHHYSLYLTCAYQAGEATECTAPLNRRRTSAGKVAAKKSATASRRR